MAGVLVPGMAADLAARARARVERMVVSCMLGENIELAWLLSSQGPQVFLYSYEARTSDLGSSMNFKWRSSA